MMKLFIGMIVGSVMTIFAAGGQPAANLVTQNIMILAQDSLTHPQMLMIGMSLWGGAVFSMSWIKRRRKPPKTSQYAYLLR